MLAFIDNILNRVTMYRLILYYLVGLWAVALLFSLFGVLPFQPLALVFSAALIIALSWAGNTIFSGAYETPANYESPYITAMILVLILTPPDLSDPRAFIELAGWAALWSMACKYILSIGRKHIFNPAAFAVALMSFTLNQSATWWIGNLPMAAFVAIGGILVVRKIRRFDLVASFLAAALVSILAFALLRGVDPMATMRESVVRSSLLFFAFVMITEPLTTPPTRPLRVAYGILVGLLFAPQVHIGPVYSTPELALLVGNLFSYIISPKAKLFLKLKEKVEVAKDTYDFVFDPGKKINFRPGQYMEWTLGHDHSDSRGNRRYFTIASSPTEQDFRMGVKFYENPSTYKKKLLALENGGLVIASQLAGDFVLPKDPGRKLVFIAGGIGVTPFRSMVKYLLDRGEKRDVVVIYCVKTPDEIAYRDVFDQAERDLGIKTVYVVGDPQGEKFLHCRTGRLTDELICVDVPDFLDRTFYVSGPHSMVTNFQKMLKGLGVRPGQIKTDFFPGFA